MKMLSSSEVDDLLKLIPESAIFTVVFVKQDGTVRKMVCRRGVKKYLKGGEATYKANKHLVGVFDMRKKEYRCFNKLRVMEIHYKTEELLETGENDSVVD